MARLGLALAVVTLLALVLVAPTGLLGISPARGHVLPGGGPQDPPPPPSLVPPQVLSTSPGPQAVVGPLAVIEIRFTAQMDASSVESAFSFSDGYRLFTALDGSPGWTNGSATNDTFQFDPDLEFATGGTVTVLIDGRAARDSEANLLDGNRDGIGGDAYSWSFTIVPDSTPPRVVEVEPADGLENVSITASITIRFSKAMSVPSVEAMFVLTGPAAPTLTIANGTAAWTGTRFPDDTFHYNPDPNLQTETPYTLSLGASGSTDREGHGLDGDGDGVAEGSPTDDLASGFATEAEDVSAPTVTGRTPAALASNVNPTTWIVAVFTERMNRASVELGFSYTDGSSVFTIANGTASWNSGVDVFSFRPARTLAFGVMVTVALNAQSARDEAGNLLNGGTNETWRFSTAAQSDTTPPRILWTTPFEGQQNVSRTHRFSIIFSEAMDRATVRNAIGIGDGIVLTDFRWPNDATVEFAAASPLEYRSSYVLFVRAFARDASGNEMVQSRQIQFMTEAWRGTVWGRVEDVAGAPVGGARVQLGVRVVLTNVTGAFSFGSVEQGTYTLSVSRDGFEPHAQEIVIDPEQGGIGAIVLQPVVPPSDARLAILAGGVVLGAIGLLAFLWWRRRPKAEAPYETWKPAQVTVLEPPGGPESEPTWDEGELEREPR